MLCLLKSFLNSRRYLFQVFDAAKGGRYIDLNLIRLKKKKTIYSWFLYPYLRSYTIIMQCFGVHLQSLFLEWRQIGSLADCARDEAVSF